MSCFPVSCFSQELPEQAYLHPPLTLFVVEQRAFGRLALVGSHVVQSLMDYALKDQEEEPDEDEEEPPPKRKNTNSIYGGLSQCRNLKHCTTVIS